jgi:hypothetical protein
VLVDGLAFWARGELEAAGFAGDLAGLVPWCSAWWFLGDQQ